MPRIASITASPKIAQLAMKQGTPKFFRPSQLIFDAPKRSIQKKLHSIVKHQNNGEKLLNIFAGSENILEHFGVHHQLMTKSINTLYFLNKLVNNVLLAAQKTKRYTKDLVPFLAKQLNKHQKDSLVLTISRRKPVSRPNYIKWSYGIPEQGNIGDCWLLSPEISILKTNPKALRGTVKKKRNGDRIVTLPGLDKSYIVTREDLVGNNHLSTKNLNTRAREIAVERYALEHSFKDISVTCETRMTNKDCCHTINGNEAEFGYKILTGKEAIKLDPAKPKDYEKIVGHIKCGNAATASTHEDYYEIAYATTKNHKKILLLKGHTYSIDGVKDGQVILTNPHHIRTQYFVSEEDFRRAFVDVTVLKWD